MPLAAGEFDSAFIEKTPQFSFNSVFEKGDTLAKTAFFDGVIEAEQLPLPDELRRRLEETAARLRAIE